MSAVTSPCMRIMMCLVMPCMRIMSVMRGRFLVMAAAKVRGIFFWMFMLIVPILFMSRRCVAAVLWRRVLSPMLRFFGSSCLPNWKAVKRKLLYFLDAQGRAMSMKK